MNKKIALLMSFLLPLLITLIVCISHEVYPFGDQCILHVDMYHQYAPFFTALMEKLKSGGSPFYSWEIGLGADFVSLYAYYLASPVNLLLIFCPADHVIEFMTILVVLKTALCGLTFAVFLMEHFSVEKLAGEQKAVAQYGAAVFGMTYAVSAFMAAYAWNIMWTDCMVLAPLAVLGLERLILQGKPVLYYVSLALSIVCNYYISIMICIFLVLWFLIFWWQNRSSGILAWVRFAVYSLLAGGTGMVLILPTAIVLGYSGNQGLSFPETVEWYFSITAELGRQLALAEPYSGAEHWPNLYCGVFVVAFFVLYLLNKSIPAKRKAPMALLAVLFVVSFANNVLDFLWHGLHFPTSLPGRQSFLYAFVLLMISYEAFLALRRNRCWHVALALLADLAFLGMAYANGEEAMIGRQGVLVSAVFMGIYLALVLGYLAGGAKVRRLMLAVGCMAMVTEAALNYDRTGLETVTRTYYVEDRADYAALLARAEQDAAEDGELFYRMEELERKTKNDAMLYGYRSGTQFSSLMNLNVSHFYQDLGMEGGKNYYCAGSATPLLSAMLSIRYVLADNGMEANPLRKLVAQSGENWLYENTYVLPVGFFMSEDVLHAWNYKDYGKLEAQNLLVWLLGGGEQLLVPVPSVSEPGASTCVAEEAGCYFATYDSTGVEDATLETGSGRTRSYAKFSHGYTMELGYCEAGEQMTVKNSDGETLTMYFYRLNEEALRDAVEKLGQSALHVTSVSDNGLEGTIAAEEEGRLIFSVAREDGWKLYVDGEEQETEPFGEAFLSVHLTEGEHEIRLRYETPGFRLGAAVSAASVLAFAGCLCCRAKRGKLSDRKKEKGEY